MILAPSGGQQPAFGSLSLAPGCGRRYSPGWQQAQLAVGRVASVGDELANAASEAVVFMVAVFDEGSPPEDVLRAALSDDFAYEDRRRGWTFPDADAEYYPKVLLSIWQTGAAGQPRWDHETLAVRGDRFAAIVLKIDYGNGMVTESIHVFGFDATLSLLQRDVDFDLDDVDGAVAELDRLYRQSDKS